jgi:H+/gluconate symporter-like permease
MAGDPLEVVKSATGGLLGAFGLSPKALLAVTLLAVVVWGYFQNRGMPLTTSETAVVVLALALLVVGARAVFGLFRRRESAPDKPQ